MECRARNSVGEQSEPCLFKLLHVGKPRPVDNCSTINVTSDSVYVTCIYDDDDRPTATSLYFQVLVANLSSNNIGHLIVHNLTQIDWFSIQNLQPGRNYIITISAINVKGEPSDPLDFTVSTLPSNQLLGEFINIPILWMI